MKVEDKDYLFRAVPLTERIRFYKLFFVMIGYTFFSASVWFGSQIGNGLSFKEALIVILLGNFILALFGGSLSYIGAKTGLSTHLLARYSFGIKGAYICSFLISATQIGWFGIGLSTLAEVIEHVGNIPRFVSIVICGIFIMITSFFGVKAIALLSMIAVPIISFLGVSSVNVMINDIGGFSSVFQYEPSGTLSMESGLIITMVAFISGALSMADFTRYAKTSKDAVVSAIFSLFIGSSFLFLIGVIMVISIGDISYEIIGASEGLLLPTILAIALCVWTTNGNSLYASGIGFAIIFTQSKKVIIIINGIIGMLLSSWIYSNFDLWFYCLALMLPPIGAIMITDYFFLRKRQYVTYEDTMIGSFHIPAFIAWIVGISSAYVIPCVFPITIILVSSVVYYGLVKVMKSSVVRKKVE